jgi:hypothetical protein
VLEEAIKDENGNYYGWGDYINWKEWHIKIGS